MDEERPILTPGLGRQFVEGVAYGEKYFCRLPDELILGEVGHDPPPLNWSILRYVFGHEKQDRNAEKHHKPEEIVAKLRRISTI